MTSTRVQRKRPAGARAAAAKQPSKAVAKKPGRAAPKFGKDELSTGLGKKLRLASLRSGEGLQPARRTEAGLRVDGRTTGDALWGMQDILEGPRLDEPTDRGSRIVRNPPDVNDKDDWFPNRKRNVRAKEEVAANAPLEEAMLKRMSPQDREAYRAVRAQLEKSGDAVALLSLQKLLFTGKLPGQKDALGRMTLLQRLGEIANGRAPLDAGVSRTALLTDLVQELATPTAINQGPRGTCGPTTALVELAMKNPAEYARIAMDLASPRGECTLVSGAVIRREPGTGPSDGTGRSQVQRLLAPALMEAANGKDYVDQTGENAGTTAEEQARLHDLLFGTSWAKGDFTYLADTAEARRAATRAMIDALAKGKPTPAMIFIGGDGEFVNHWVLVTGREMRDGQEYVRYVNPWGQEELMPIEEFERRLRGVGQDAG